MRTSAAYVCLWVCVSERLLTQTDAEGDVEGDVEGRTWRWQVAAVVTRQHLILPSQCP